jgi:hypothetical protein
MMQLIRFLLAAALCLHVAPFKAAKPFSYHIGKLKSSTLMSSSPNPVYPSEKAEFGEAAMTDVIYAKTSTGPGLLSGGRYAGDINFCLRSTDTALSGTSRSKILNDITNQAFKALIIGYEPLIEDVLSRFEEFADVTENAVCYLGDEDKLPIVNLEENREKDCTQDKLRARNYLENLQKLLLNGHIEAAVLGGIYDQSYKRLLTVLRDAGCIGFASSDMPPRCVDIDICLSTMDRTFMKNKRSRTRELNKIANIVSRAIIYGGIAEKNLLAKSIENNLESFASEWLGGNINAQEIAFLRALVVMLKEGALKAAQLVGYLPTASEEASEGPEEPMSQPLADTFDSQKESSVRSTSTISRTMERMREVGDSSSIGGVISTAYSPSECPPLRLFDSYQIAFQRVIEACLIEINKRTEYIPQNEEVLLNFVNWERTVRRGLTDKMWKQNPSELVGTWKLLDVAGQGSLSKIMTSAAAGIDQSATEVPVELKPEGGMEIDLPDFEGTSWSFTPGPAHLDTLEFVLQSKSESKGFFGWAAREADRSVPDLTLQYVGFIDRGQRIESRLSGNPVRMTGRVVSIVKGEWKVSNR